MFQPGAVGSDVSAAHGSVTALVKSAVVSVEAESLIAQCDLHSSMIMMIITFFVSCLQGQEKAKNEDVIEAKESIQCSFCCNATSVIFFAFTVVTLGIVIPIAITMQ